MIQYDAPVLIYCIAGTDPRHDSFRHELAVFHQHPHDDLMSQDKGKGDWVFKRERGDEEKTIDT